MSPPRRALFRPIAALPLLLAALVGCAADLGAAPDEGPARLAQGVAIPGPW